MSSDEYDWSEDDSYLDEPVRKPPNIYTVMSITGIAKAQWQLVQEFGASLGISDELATILLFKHNWNPEKALAAFFDNYESLNLPDFAQIAFHESQISMCPLCCEEEVPAVDLGCGHAVCLVCFTKYVRLQIFDERNLIIKCPGDIKCRHICVDDTIQRVCDDFAWRSYVKLRVESWLPNVKRLVVGCPTPDCKYYVQRREPLVAPPPQHGTAYEPAVAQCACKCFFCFLCGQSHLPVSCELSGTWQRISNDSSISWIRHNTKQCPKCYVAIQKNMGCAHMSCRCGHHFCWECLGDFSDYNHRCAMYDISREKREVRDKQALHRLAHYAPRIALNLGGASLHFRLLANLREADLPKGEDPLAEFPAFVEDRDTTMADVHTCLAHARGLLGWTFVLLYFTNDGNDRVVLEDCVINLEQATENLGHDVLHNKRLPKGDLVRRAAYVKQRHEKLLRYAMQNGWGYEEYMMPLLHGGEINDKTGAPTTS